jgi:predicted O-linked N-acetylglucosamine transferase (SPINDLY family)
MTVDQAFELAMQHHMAGRLAEAEALYRQILAAEPNHANACQFLGVIAHHAGRHDLAVEWIARALQLEPNNPVAYTNLGEALRAAGRREDAEAACRRALELQPDYAQPAFNLTNLLREQGRLEEALALALRTVEQHPGSHVARLCLGNVLRDQGDLDGAIAAYRQALDLQPGYAEAANNLGVALRRAGRLEEAAASLRRALELRPGYAEPCNNLGNVLRTLGRLDEAVAAYRQAIAFDSQPVGVSTQTVAEFRPSLAEAHLNLGATLAELGDFPAAVESCRRATELRPDLAAAHHNLGSTLAQCDEIDAALAAYERARQLQPDDSELYISIGNARKDQGRTGDALAAYRHAVELDPKSFGARCNLNFTLHYHPDAKAEEIAGAHESWNRQFCDPAKKLPPSVVDRDPERPLRIGYVSADLRDHVVGRNILPLFRHHDHRSFEIHGYAGVLRPDALTAEFRQRSDQWRSTCGVEDDALAGLIRDDRIDILVDLAQHTSGNRLRMFAREPAPLQLSFAGYPASAAVEAIRYRISDGWLEGDFRLPIGDCRLGEAFMRPETSETAAALSCLNKGCEHVYLVDSFWCYDPCGAVAEPNPLPARTNGHVTFGCLNNFCKTNDRVLRLWAQVLRRVPGSHLLLLSGFGSHRQATIELMAGEGIDPARVGFLPPQRRLSYLELYHRLDIVLDTFPYNGHTTSLDALWMGVPVVSLAGQTSVSRGGLSQLTNLGLRELVAFTPDEYVEIAARLALDLPRLEEVRRTLRERMESCVLMDAARFARSIETVYRTIWRAWCRGWEPVGS